MANIIEIIVRAKDEASAAIAKSTKSIQDLESAAKTAALPFAALAVAGTAVIAKTTLTAARTEELGLVVENLGRVSGKSTRELEDTETSIKDLGITTQAARAIMAQMMGAELDLARGTDIARAAQDLAVISMQDSSEAAQDMLYAITSLQPRVLRKYNIFVDLNNVYEKTAASLGKNVDELTEADRRTGMLNITLEQAARYQGTYEAAMETAGKQLRSLNRYTEKASEELGEHYLPYLGMAVETTGKLLEGFSGLDDGTQEIIASTIMYATVIAGSIAVTMGAVVATSKLTAGLQALKLVMVAHPLLIIPTALAILGTAAIQSAAAFDEQKKQVKKNADTMEDYLDGVADLIPVVDDAGTGQRGFARDASLAAKELAKATAATELHEDAMQEMVQKWMPLWNEEQREINRLIEEGWKETENAARVLSYDMATALAGNIIGLGENIERYQELEDTVITAHIDMAAGVADYSRDVEQLGTDRAAALTKLEEKQAEEIWKIEAGGLSRSAEATEAAIEWQRGIHATELGEFNTLWDDKGRRRTDDYELAKTQAWSGAEERRKAEEAARVAEMEALKAAQKERLLLFTLEMAETAGLLKIPLKGWEDVEVGAQEYMDLVKAGIIPVSDDVTSYMGGALIDLQKMWDETGGKGGSAMQEWQSQLDILIPDVMNLGSDATDSAMTMESEIDTRIIRALMDGQTEVDEMSSGIVDLADTTYTEAGGMETSIGGYSDKLVTAKTRTGDLEDKTDTSFRAMRGDINKATEDMEEYAEATKAAMRAFNKLQQLEGGGGAPFEPGLQRGLAYVPATMPARLHEGEAVLTKQQAEVWRSQFNVNVGNVYGMDGFEEQMDNYWWRSGSRR